MSQLLRNKIPVRCLVRAGSKRGNLAGLDIEYVIGDMNDRPSLEMALRDCTLLFHVAADYRLWAAPDPEEMIRVNVEETRQLLEAAGRAKIERIVYTSSVAAIGRPSVDGQLGPGREDLDPRPVADRSIQAIQIFVRQTRPRDGRAGPSDRDRESRRADRHPRH